MIKPHGGDGLYPIHYACWQEDTRILDLLVEKGADVNVKSVGPSKHTPLYMFVLNMVRTYRQIFALIKHKPNPFLTDSDGKNS